MNPTLITDETFHGISELGKGDYDNCTFINCALSNAHLNSINFTSCTFKNCDLSLAKLSGTSFKEVTFKSCKLLGLHFEHCNPFLFAVHFDECVLNLSSFHQLKLKETIFNNCQLQETDFAACDLTAARFDTCNLAGAIFENTILEKADFRTAVNFAIDPENNRIKKAKFSRDGLPGLLYKYQLEID